MSHGSVQMRVTAGTGACVQMGYRPRPTSGQVGRLPGARRRPSSGRRPYVARCARACALRLQESGAVAALQRRCDQADWIASDGPLVASTRAAARMTGHYSESP